jgi:hypothetical protein
MDRRAIASDGPAPRGRRPRARNQVSRAGTGRSRLPAPEIGAGVRAVNLTSTTAMYGDGKSDRPIVPEKPPNKGRDASRAAEGVEERGLTKGNSFEQNRLRTPSRAKGRARRTLNGHEAGNGGYGQEPRPTLAPTTTCKARSIGYARPRNRANATRLCNTWMVDPR